MDAQEDIFNNSEKILFISSKEHNNLTEALKKFPEFRKLAQEYYKLINQETLSETDTHRISKIYELAEYDELLDECIDKIEESISIIEQLTTKRLSIEEFIEQVESISPQEMTPEKFKKLVKSLNFSPDFLHRYIDFKNHEYNRKLILHTSFGCIYVIAWKPGQKTGIHDHSNSFSVINVYKGTLSHILYTEVNHLYNQKGYRQIKERQFTDNQWLHVDISQIHQLANESNENLITLHFRYFKNPVDDKLPLPGCQPNNQKTTLVSQQTHTK